MQNSPARGPEREPGALDAMETREEGVAAAAGREVVAAVPALLDGREAVGARRPIGAVNARDAMDAAAELDVDDALEATVVLDLEEARALLGDDDDDDANNEGRDGDDDGDAVGRVDGERDSGGSGGAGDRDGGSSARVSGRAVDRDVGGDIDIDGDRDSGPGPDLDPGSGLDPGLDPSLDHRGLIDGDPAGRAPAPTGAFAARAAARPHLRSSALRLAHAALRHAAPPHAPAAAAARDDALTAVHLRARGAGAPMPVTPPVSLRPGDLRALATVERAAVAVLDAGIPPATSIEAAYRRKERELRALFAPLGPGAAELLHARLVAARPGDPLAARFHRLVADRRLRLLAFLADAPRRDALARARRPGP